MNPASLLGGGGASLQQSASSGASGTGGDSSGSSASGVKNISFGGGNPNTVGGFFSNPLVLVAAVAGIYLVMKK
ncbi:hypothetical protein [Agarilytica rhodophyticola]|uniref:hypothetical protein n=1 Tax=Agarilytica rhodophyticola TaxID=1737490 RepID=UPI000B3440FC|nr:hypothetical protein [Agarilytica rhodophyticola]